MKRTRVIAVLEADVNVTPLGTRSRLAADLCGTTVLRRTVDRVRNVHSVSRVVIACPVPQKSTCERLVDGTGALVIGHDAGPAPWRSLVRCARKWSLDGWRGGIGGVTVFDEYTDCRILAEILVTEPADFVLSAPPAAPFFDTTMADQLVRHLETDEFDSQLVFTQTSPGLSGILLSFALVRELADKKLPLGQVFAYKPDAPRKDLIFESCCIGSPVELRHAAGRLIVDTERALQTAKAILKEGADSDSATVGRWLMRREPAFVDSVPREVEIELTTEDPYPDSLHLPRGRRVKTRGPIPPSVVGGVASEMARYDDALVVLGGFGDPLLHPNLKYILEALRPAGAEGAGVYGLAIRTTGVQLSDEIIRLLMEFRVDVLEVMLDAWTPELYGRLHSPTDPSKADLDGVLARINAVERIRQERRSVHPIVLPSFTKAKENVHELDAFYDGWTRKLGAVCVAGFSHRAGQIEDRSVICMAPPGRSACRHLQSRCVVLADGNVTMCDQDFNCRHPIGVLESRLPAREEYPTDGFSSIWQSAAYQQIRRRHREGHFDEPVLCLSCDEWHRP